MRVVTAALAAVLVFFAVVVAWGVLVPAQFAFPRPEVPIPILSSNTILTTAPGLLMLDNVVGLLLALLAALCSYSATMRCYRQK